MPRGRPRKIQIDRVPTNEVTQEIPKEIPKEIIGFTNESNEVKTKMPMTTFRFERQNAIGEPIVRALPDVKGGVCDYCGILDPNVPSQYQYKLCPHYRGRTLRCSYCPAEADPDEVARSRKIIVREHPDKPGVMIACCSSYECERQHQKRFVTSH